MPRPNKTIQEAIRRWTPAHGDNEQIIRASRAIVAGAEPRTADQARIAAGYIHSYLVWAVAAGHHQSADVLTTELIEQYLEHLRASGTPTGTVNAKKSYLKRCVPGHGGLQKRRKPGSGGERTVEEVIAEYEPDRLDPSRWHTVRPVVMEAVHAVRPDTPASAAQFMTVTSLYVAWAADDHQPLFAPASVEAFIGAGAAVWSKATTRTYTSVLRSVARSSNPSDWPPKPIRKRFRQQPYSSAELAKILDAIAGRPAGRVKRNLEAAYVLAVGAGVIGIEAATVTPDDVINEHPPAVRVRGRRARVVVLGSAYGARLLELADTAASNGERFLLGGGPSRDERQRDLWRLLQATEVNVDPSRLRFTWLTQLIALPIPLAAVVEQTGVLAPDTLLEALSCVEGYDRMHANSVISRGVS